MTMGVGIGAVRRMHQMLSSRAQRGTFRFLNPALVAPGEHVELRQHRRGEPAVLSHAIDQPAEAGHESLLVDAVAAGLDIGHVMIARRTRTATRALA